MTMTDEATPAPVKSQRPRIVWVFGALALVVLLIGLAGGSFQSKLGDVQKNDNSSFLPASADSTKVQNAQQKFADVQTIPGFVLYQRSGGTITAADRAKIARDLAAFARVKGIATDQLSRAPQLNKAGDIAVVTVPLVAKMNGKAVKGPDLVDAEKKVLTIAKADANGLSVKPAGAGGLIVAFIDAFDGLDGALLGAAAIVVIVLLLLVYRSPVLWFFPLFSAALALGASSIVIYALAKNNVITLNGQSQGILSVLVIGAGTDYALLLVSRYREELHEYDSRVQAMIAAWKGAAPPILASAATVILGLICLTFAEVKGTSGLGPVCAIGIAATVVVMLTVLPTMLVLSGRWIFWPKRPTVDHVSDILEVHGVWSRFAKGVTRRRRTSWAVSGLVLIGCVLAISTLKTDGLSTANGFTTKPDAVKGQDLYNANFDKGAGAPAVILANADKAQDVIKAVTGVQGVDTGSGAVCVEIDYAKLATLLKQNPSAAGAARAGCAPSALQVAPVGGKTLIDAKITSSFDSRAAYDTVQRIRSAVDKVDGADALVGGQSAVNLDLQDAARHDTKLIIPLTLLVILIVLGLVLRALVAPVLLILTVVLSFAASLGVSAIFFNHVFDFVNSDPSFPLFAFVFLVALGIDYNIFLMTRVREETLQHGTREGIVRGLAVTGGVITSAGLVLAATFVVLGVLPIVFLAEIGFTVAFGVLLDTFVVRSILVPAIAYDIGKKIWWPSKLARAAD